MLRGSGANRRRKISPPSIVMASTSSPAFYAFPKTPHILGSAQSHLTDDKDEEISLNDLKKMATKAVRLVLQEKVDGANVSVHFEREWEPVLQKRSGIIGQGERHKQYNVWRDYVMEHSESLFSLLSTRYCLFGEWLWNQHSVAYDALPSYLLIFDIYDKENAEWLSRNRIENLLEPFQGEFHLVPNLAIIDLHDSQAVSNLDQQFKALRLRKSHYSSENQEGIYIRAEDEQKVVYRAKLRRDTFVAGRDDFRITVNNKLLE